MHLLLTFGILRQSYDLDQETALFFTMITILTLQKMLRKMYERIV